MRHVSEGLRIRLLGPLSVSNGAKPVTIASKKARALLGYLALREGVEVPRSVLTSLFWGERSEDQARASLRQTLSELRGIQRAPIRQSVIATKETVRWAPRSAWIDAKLIEAAADSGSEAAQAEAADAIGGELMEGLNIGETGFEQWLTTERERFRLLSCRIYMQLADRMEARGKVEEALTQCLKLIALDPLQEHVHRTIMRLYAAQGRLDAALAQYQRCRHELTSQLGVAPESQTDDLMRAIKAGRQQKTRPRISQSEHKVHITIDRPSIAVLPFSNLSGNPDQEYFSDGITEDIITELSRYHTLLVIARNSSFHFRGSAADIDNIREKLHVDYVVEGSVRKAGNQMRVTAQLVDAATATHLWAERYDRQADEIFAVQDEVTRAVVATLEGRIAAIGAQLTRKKPTADWKAYDYFLQGRELAYRYQKEEAEPLFMRAIELDPGYVHAHAWRALALCIKYLIDGQQQTINAALSSAKRAMELDENDAWANQAMGFVSLRRHEFDLAGHYFDRAVSLNPNDVLIGSFRANWLMLVGRLGEALAGLDEVLKRDPFPPTWYWDIRGYVLFHLKRYGAAIVAFKNMPTPPLWTSAMLAASYAQLGQHENAQKEIAIYLKMRPGATLRSAASQNIYADRNLQDHWLEGLRKAGLPE
jgi:TolB-like protein/Tfp pilus assembly protein PilF